MPDELWGEVDSYLEDLLVRPDEALRAALAASAAAGLPAINVTPSQGKFLSLLARLHRASTILEVGTLGGYSTIWLARALPPDGRLITLEINPRHAEVARANLARAGLTERVELRLAPAGESLQGLVAEGRHVFDLVFIDADKPGNADYFTQALALTKAGSVIVVDNVVRQGKLLDSSGADANVEGARRVLELMAAEPRVTATALQTVGSKGHDGFAIALVHDPLPA